MYAYASGQPSDDGAGAARLDHAARTPNAGAAARSSPRAAGVPAAPSSSRAPARKPASVSGVRLSASASARARRAASTSLRQSTSRKNGLVADELLGRRAATVAGDVAGRHRHEMRARRRGCAASATMRVGPSRLTSTAPSSGESNDTVAAEWMTMSQEASAARPGVVEAEPVGADVAGDHCDPPGDHLVEALAERSARSRSNASLRKISRWTRWSTRTAAPRADEQHDLAVGHARGAAARRVRCRGTRWSR